MIRHVHSIIRAFLYKVFRTWPVAPRLALPETGEHGRGGSKHSACSSKKVRKIARMFLSDAEILSGRGPGCTGLEGGVSEGRLRLSVVEIKPDGRGGLAVCRGQTLRFSDRRTLGKNGERCCGALGLDGNSNVSFSYSGSACDKGDSAGCPCRTQTRQDEQHSIVNIQKMVCFKQSITQI